MTTVFTAHRVNWFQIKIKLVANQNQPLKLDMRVNQTKMSFQDWPGEN